MRLEQLLRSRVTYLALCVPFILAFASWRFFPVLAEWLVRTLFRYEVVGVADPFWLGTVLVLYSWYTFLTIGVVGVWIVAAALERLRQDSTRQRSRPTVSLIVPAWNEEGNISRCINSLYKCAEAYTGQCEIIVVDDGSSDYTYEVAWAAIELNRRRAPQVRGRVVRHSSNLGKVEAIKTGVDRVLGSVVGVVDADSWWIPDTLTRLVDSLLLGNKKAVTGYVNPSDGDRELNPYVVLQQLEYSQGLGINRCAQSLGNNVLVVSGAIGLYDAEVLRGILAEKSVFSVTEDLEITAEMHKRGKEVGYVSVATSSTVVPHSFKALWNQRLRWFAGWFHNTLKIHRDLLRKKSWVALLIWYCYVFEYGAAFVDAVSLCALPFLFWFAPDRVFFVAAMLIFLPYGLLISVIGQTIALKYAYNRHNYHQLLLYTPFYSILRLINMLARLASSIKYLLGDNGTWTHK